MTIPFRPICRNFGESCRCRCVLMVLCLLVSVVVAGCGSPTVAPAETATGSGPAPAAASNGGGFTISVDGATLQFSEAWTNGGSAPGNPGKGAMLGRTPQEASTQGISFVVMPLQVPDGISAEKFMELLTSFSDSQFSKMDKDTEVPFSGAKVRFQLIRTFGNPNATGPTKEDSLQHKWTLNAGNKLVQIIAVCRESQLPQAGPEFENVFQTLKIQ